MDYIQSYEGVAAAAEALGAGALFAADTEAAGYHRYRDRVCLLQLSTRRSTYLIDTLAITDLDPLAPRFADPDIEVILHDADYDLRLLARDYGIQVRGLFDTKVAAQLLGETAFGLGALVEKFVGTQLDKKHQRADWAQRPLPQALLAYAADDTRYLPELRDRLKVELERAGRLHWAQEEFALREDTRWGNGNDQEAYLRVKNTRDLTSRQLAALRELHRWREGVAERRDVAPFRVVSNEVLVAIARELPAHARALAATAGVPASIAERMGPEMLAAVDRARALPDIDLPRRVRPPRRPPPDAAFEERVERLKRVRDQVATELGLDRGFLMPRQQLEHTARSGVRTNGDLLQVPDMRRWQVEVLGERLLEAL